MDLADDLARMLYENFVERADAAFELKAVVPRAGKVAERAYLNKVLFYRQSAVLFCLWSAAIQTSDTEKFWKHTNALFSEST